MTFLFLDQIDDQIRYGKEKYGHFNSCHEGYGVLLEEVNEFWDLVKVNKTKNYDHDALRNQMVNELIQIASVSIRLATEIHTEKIKHL